jgi:putative hydrolase of the HAD superfamily
MARYLIWDFDDTLGYRVGGKWTASLMKVLQDDAPDFPADAKAISPHLQSGFPWHTPEIPHTHITSADAWWEHLNPLFAKTFRNIGLSPDEAGRLAGRVREVYIAPSSWKLFDDTRPALSRLAELGWTHCLLSNHVPELPRILAYLYLLEEFAVISNSADTGYEKPHLEAFNQVLKALPEPGAVWMIGDGYQADIAGARALGIPGLLVRKTHPQAERCCADLSEVVAFLQAEAGI